MYQRGMMTSVQVVGGRHDCLMHRRVVSHGVLLVKRRDAVVRPVRVHGRCEGRCAAQWQDPLTVGRHHGGIVVIRLFVPQCGIDVGIYNRIWLVDLVMLRRMIVKDGLAVGRSRRCGGEGIYAVHLGKVSKKVF
jgi:hypothetical protein